MGDGRNHTPQPGDAAMRARGSAAAAVPRGPAGAAFRPGEGLCRWSPSYVDSGDSRASQPERRGMAWRVGSTGAWRTREPSREQPSASGCWWFSWAWDRLGANRGETSAARARSPSRSRGGAADLDVWHLRPSRGAPALSIFRVTYRDSDFEDTPSELGAIGEEDYRGRYRANEGLFFVTYGLSDMLAVEFEVAVISASLRQVAC